MARETRKLWARGGVVSALMEAEGKLRKAQKYAGAMPAKLRRRLDRLAGQVEALERAVRAWPITQEERARVSRGERREASDE